LGCGSLEKIENERGAWAERAQVDVEALLRRAQMRTMQIVVATPLPDAHRTCKLPPSRSSQNFQPVRFNELCSASANRERASLLDSRWGKSLA
jgi:hypothetical protein